MYKVRVSNYMSLPIEDTELYVGDDYFEAVTIMKRYRLKIHESVSLLYIGAPDGMGERIRACYDVLGL